MGNIAERLLVRAVFAGIGLCTMGFGVVGLPPKCVAETIIRNQNNRNEPSLTESISSGVKKGVDGFTRMVTPKPKIISDEDPVSLSTEAKPSAKLYLAVARLFEQSGKPAEAQEQYRNALKHEPTNLAALLGYARLKDRLGQPEIALQLYLKAGKAHPNDPSAHNNLALLHARQGRLDDAVISLRKAIRLQPRGAKYRNNIATVLVETGRAEEALAHLRAVHREPVANYNLGYLLEKHGDTSAALRYFAVALSADPSLTPARQAIDRLARTLNQAQRPIATRPAEPQRGPPAVSAQRVEDRRVEDRFTPAWPPRGQAPLATSAAPSIAAPSIAAPSTTASPNTPPSPPMVNLPQVPRAFGPRPPQVVLPEPSITAAPSTVVSPPSRTRLEPPAEPAIGPRSSLPQVRLLPLPPSGYQPRRPLPKATGMRPGQMLPSVTVPRRLPPTSRNGPVDSRLPGATAPLPPSAEDGPILHHLPPVQ